MPSTKTKHPSQAVNWLQQGKLLAYPTESVWGLGCDAYNELAVHQVLKIKNRSINKGLIVVTDSADRIKPLLKGLSITQRQQVVNSWQQVPNAQSVQAQTWLLPLINNHDIPRWITGQHNSIAVRVIAHPLIKILCQHIANSGNPYGFVVSTSCNPATRSPAKNFSEAYGYFGEQIRYLQGDTLGYTQPSQIRDALTGSIVR